VDVRLLAASLAAAACLLVPAPALAADTEPVAGSTAGAPAPPEVLPDTPEDFEVTAAEAVRLANADPKVAEQGTGDGALTTAIQVNDEGLWQVGYKRGDEEVVQIKVDPHTGAIVEAWTGYQVLWPMARGNEGQFGHILNAPYVWLPMALVFLLGLFDFARPLRIAHLDLLVLLSFGVSHYFFNRGDVGLSVPLVYPPLVYLFARMAWIGFRGGSGLRPSLPVSWIGVAAVVLIAFRLTINIADAGVIDVGYAGTIGADRLTHGEQLWGEGEFPDDNRFGDTYGPVNYYAYVPFELALPWSGEWDNLPSSHGAAIAFDLAAMLGLFFAGARLRPGRAGRELGILMSFAWAAYPYTDFALQSNSNDSLVAALLIWSLALFARPVARGVMLGLATMTKFAPLALAPLYLSGYRGLLTAARGWRARLPALGPVAAFALGFAAVVAVILAHPAIEPGHLLRSHGGQSDRPNLAVQRVGPGRRHPVAPDGGPGGDRGVRRGTGLRAKPPDAPADRGACRRRDDRAAALGRPLVLPVHPLVLRAARGRAPGPAAGRRRGGSRARGRVRTGCNVTYPGGVMETEPSDAQLEDPNDQDLEEPSELGDDGEDELGGGESAGEDEAPTGP
jgi:hypothetical protein